MTSPTGEPLTVEVVTKEIIDLLRPEVKGAELTGDSSLVSSGLDSVSIVSLIYKVEKRYSIVPTGQGYWPCSHTARTARLRP